MKLRILLVPLLLGLLTGCLAPEQTDDNPGRPEETPPDADDGRDGPCVPVAVDAPVEVSYSNSASISDQPGQFSFSRSGTIPLSRTSYAWTNPSGATTFSGTVSGSGRMILQVYDACGQLMMDRTFSGSSQTNSDTLPPGEPGEWVVRVAFEAFSGSVSFSLNA